MSSSHQTNQQDPSSSPPNDQDGVQGNNNHESQPSLVPPPPLIDVDCNLLHPDLFSLLLRPEEEEVEVEANEKPNVNHDLHRCFRILQHPSTISSNIHAVFSPSSTIDEAETLLPLLMERGDHNPSTTPSSIADNDDPHHIRIRTSVGVHPYNTGPQDDDDEDGQKPTIITPTIQQRIQQLFQIDRRQPRSTTTTTSIDDNDNDPQQPQQPQQPHYITCIGETGLDYSEGFPSKHQQIPWFRYQLELAKEYHLPLFVHERLAHDDLLEIIDDVFPTTTTTTTTTASSSIPPVLIHCFTGTTTECQEYIKRGYYLSLSGYIRKKGDGPDAIRDCLRNGHIPLNRLMIETDAPYMGFPTCRASYYQTMEEYAMEEEEKKTKDDDNDDGNVVVCWGIESYRRLSSKKKKKLIKSFYPNVPSSLPLVLEQIVECVNEGRVERGEEVMGLDEVATILYENSVDFFGF